MNYTTDDYARLRAGFEQVIPIENLFCSYCFSFENSLLDDFFMHLVELDHNSENRLLCQLPALRKHQERKASDIQKLKNIPNKDNEYKLIKYRLKREIKEFFIANSITGYFVEFCIRINLPFSLDENGTWDGEWFYFPNFDLNKIEQKLNYWAEAKRSEWIRRYTRSGLFSILHAPSLLTVSQYAVTESNICSALKDMPDESQIFDRLPALRKIKTYFPKKTDEFYHIDDELKFIQKMIRKESLSGFFVELGAVLVNPKKDELKHITEWVYASTLEDAEKKLTSWVLSWIVKEQSAMKYQEGK